MPGAEAVLRRAWLWLSVAALTACSSLVEDAQSPRAADDLPLHCGNWARIKRGPYRVENNTWGRGRITDWQQCVALGPGPGQAVVARFTWDWPQGRRGIKAYPEIIFGQKPSTTSTTPALPRRLQALSALGVDYAVQSTQQGVGNVAFDIWLSQTASAPAFSVPPITHEIMVWLSSQGGARPAGEVRDIVEIDGVAYAMHVAEQHGAGWQYIAFNPQTPQLGPGHIDLLKFLRHAQARGHLTGQEHVLSVELGSEIESGRGALSIDHFEVHVQSP